MAPNSASVSLRTKPPRSPAERLRLYREGIRHRPRRAAQRLHPNVLAAALANKLARIAWTVLAQERSYEARITKAAA